MGFICKYSKKEIGIQFGRILSLKEAKRWMRIKKRSVALTSVKNWKMYV